VAPRPSHGTSGDTHLADSWDVYNQYYQYQYYYKHYYSEHHVEHHHREHHFKHHHGEYYIELYNCEYLYIRGCEYLYRHHYGPAYFLIYARHFYLCGEDDFSVYFCTHLGLGCFLGRLYCVPVGG
jgi:hypothetical protein